MIPDFCKFFPPDSFGCNLNIFLLGRVPQFTEKVGERSQPFHALWHRLESHLNFVSRNNPPRHSRSGLDVLVNGRPGSRYMQDCNANSGVQLSQVLKVQRIPFMIPQTSIHQDVSSVLKSCLLQHLRYITCLLARHFPRLFGVIVHIVLEFRQMSANFIGVHRNKSC